MSVSSRLPARTRWLLATALGTLLAVQVQAIEPPETSIGFQAGIAYGSFAPSAEPFGVSYPLSLAIRTQFLRLARFETTFEVSSLDSEINVPHAVLTVGHEQGLRLAVGRSEVRSGYGSTFSANQLALPVDVDSIWQEPRTRTIPQDHLSVTWARERWLVEATVIPSFLEAPPPDADSAWTIHQGIPSEFVFPYPIGTPRTLRDVSVLDTRAPIVTLDETTALLRAQLDVGPASGYLLGYRGRTRDFQVRSRYEYPITPYVFDYDLEPVSADALLAGCGVQLRSSAVRAWAEANYGRRDRLVASSALVESGGDTAIVRFQELVPIVTTAVSGGLAVDAWVLHGEAEISWEFDPREATITAYPSLARVLSARISADIPTAIAPDGVSAALATVTNLVDGLTTVRATLSVAVAEGARTSVRMALPLSPFGLLEAPLARYGTITAGLRLSAGP